MSYYLKVDAAQVVWGATYSDTPPGDDYVAVDFDPTGTMSLATKQRLVDGVLVDTGQPTLPPHAWSVWSTDDIAWIDPRDLDQLKAAKWEEVKSARSNAEYGGFTWDGSPFDSDAASQQRIIGASQLATLNPSAFDIDWTLADNTMRTLNAAEMNAVGMTLGVHVNAQYVHARALRQQIADATTKEAVEAVVW